MGCPGNDDFFGFTAGSTGTVVIDLSFAHSNGDLDLWLLDTAGDVLSGSAGSDDNERIEHPVEAGASYTIQVRHYEGGPAPYTLIFDIACPPDQYEPNDTRETATPLAEDTLIDGMGCPDNHDFFSFTAGSTGTVVVDLSFASSNGDLDLGLWNAAGTPIASSSSEDDNERIEYPVEAGESYTIQVHHFVGGSVPYTLVFDIPSCVADQYEPNDTPETAKPLAEDTLINGWGCPDDNDYFGFTAGSTGTVVIDLSFAQSNGDLDLGLIDAAGDLVAHSAEAQDNERIEHPVEAGESFTIWINHFDGGPVPYTLVFDTACPPDQYEPNDTRETASPLAEDTLIDGWGCPDNDDFFGFTAGSTGTVIIDLSFAHSNGDLDLYLGDADGFLIAVSDGAEDNERIEHPVEAGASYTIWIAHYDGGPVPYTLTYGIEHCPPDDGFEPNDTPETATPLTENTLIEARSCPDNEDLFGFTAGSPGTVVIDLGFSATDGDIDLALLDATGQEVARSAGVVDNERIEYPVEAGADYTIWVDHLDGDEIPYSLVFDITSCPPDDQYEPNDTLNQITTPTIAEDSPLVAQACTDNPDWFKATPVLDGVISLDLSWSDDTADLTLTLHNVNEVVAVAEVTGTSAHLEYLGSAHSSYYVEVSGGETPYTLSWDQGPCPPDSFEPNDTLETGSPLAADTPIEASLCTGDDDFFAITVDERTTLVVDATNNVSELDIALYLWDASGEAIAGSENFGDNEHLEHVIDTPGTYYLHVGEFTLDNVGVYGLTWTTSPAPPGAPTDVTGVAGSTQATVSWAAPASGGSPITGYTATASPGGATCTTATTSCSVTGLANGTAYTFTVTATNVIGTGEPSAPSAPVTPSECGAGQPGPFPDVPGDHPFCTDIEWLALGGVTGGFPDGTFRPGINITRQAMAAFIYRYSGEPAFTPPATPTFSDVPTSHPFFKEIEWLASTGITGGFEDGTFRPGASITRQAAAAFFYRLAGEPAFTPPATPTFPDVPASHPFFKEIEWLATTGITGGFADGTYRPGGAVTRQAFAAFLHRYDDL